MKFIGTGYLRKCGNGKLIAVDSDNKDEEDETLTGLVSSHLGNEMNSF